VGGLPRRANVSIKSQPAGSAHVTLHVESDHFAGIHKLRRICSFSSVEACIARVVHYAVWPGDFFFFFFFLFFSFPPRAAKRRARLIADNHLSVVRIVSAGAQLERARTNGSTQAWILGFVALLPLRTIPWRCDSSGFSTTSSYRESSSVARNRLTLSRGDGQIGITQPSSRGRSILERSNAGKEAGRSTGTQ